MLASEIQLVPDQTFFYQLAIFLGVVVSLHYLVFKPALKVVLARRARTEGDRARVEDLVQKTEALVKEYESKIQEARLEGMQIKEAIRQEGEVQAQKMVHEAKQAALEQIEGIKKEVALLHQKAEKDLELQAEVFGKNLAEKVLGRPLNNLN